jgi:acyl-CoA reductase-like NAD-dependent aldehyde dehydrogenase
MAITDNLPILGMLVDGERLDAERTRTILDPSTGEAIAEVADGTAFELTGATRKPCYDAVSTLRRLNRVPTPGSTQCPR